MNSRRNRGRHVGALLIGLALQFIVVLPASADGSKICYQGICSVSAKKSASGGKSGPAKSGTRSGSAIRSTTSGSHKSGPSKLEVARKQERAIDRALVKYEAANKAYLRCIEGGAFVCNRPAVAGGAVLSGGNVVLTGQPRPAGAPPAPSITPAQAGAIAVARLQLPISTPGVGPDPDKNEWKMVAIGYPLWLWADGPTHIGPVGQNVGGLSVSLEARLARTVFRMGDGKSVSCTGGGTPYKAWVQPGAKSPNCGYVYQKPSLPAKEYRVTATTYWDVRWTVNGVSGVIQVPRQGSVDLPVGELQAVIVR